MFRMYLNQYKKIHLNDVRCLELSNSEEGSRSLRMPMDGGKLRVPSNLQPRERLKRKPTHQDMQSYEYQLASSGSATGPNKSSSSNDCRVSQTSVKSLCDFELSNNSVPARSDKESILDSFCSTSNGEGFEIASYHSDEEFELGSRLLVRNDGFQSASCLLRKSDKGFQPASHLMSKAVSGFPSGNVGLLGSDFISARQFLNPMHQHNDGKIKLESSKNGWKRHHSSPETSRNSRTSQSSTQGLPLVLKKPRTKELQKNRLDRYFKRTPVFSGPPSDKQLPLLLSRDPIDCTSETYSVPVESASEQKLVAGEAVSQNSPTKSMLWSSIQKYPGSDTIYYSPTKSQYKRRLDGENADCSLVRKSLLRDDSDFEEPVAIETHQWTSSGKKKCKLGTKAQNASNSSTSKSKLSNSEEGALPLQKLDALPGNKYGLLGCSDNELIDLGSDTDFEDENTVDEVNYFLRLPKEIVENILCRLPFTDLHLNVNRVCTAWNDVISSPKVRFFFCYIFSFLVGILSF